MFEWHHACAHARKVLGIDAFPVEHGPDVVGHAPTEARDAVRSRPAAPCRNSCAARMLEEAMPAITVDDVLVLPRVPEPDPAASRRAPGRVGHHRAPGLRGRGLPGAPRLRRVSTGRPRPFIHMDEMGEVEWEPGAAKGTSWHPHRGFETVTYMLDGTFQHQDSNGGGGVISDGDTQWMTAGGGILHIEARPRRSWPSAARSTGSSSG